MKKTKEVTCRYGVTYPATFTGSPGAVARTFDLMTRCCCWVCHNHDCKPPITRNEKLDNCGEVCKIFGVNSTYCGKERKNNG